MKRLIFLVLFANVFNFSGLSQTILNPSFDSVYFGGIDRILSWISSDGISFYSGFNGDTVNPLLPNTVYNATGFPFSESYDAIGITTSPYSNAAVVMNTKPNYKKNTGDRFETFIVNGNQFKSDNDGYLNLSSAGEPFTGRPNRLIGKYQFIDTLSLTQNAGKCIVMLKKHNNITGLIDTIAYDSYTITNFPITAGWQDFELPINYWSTDIPDSIVIAFFASVEPNSNAQFIVDDLSFSSGSTNIENTKTSPDELTIFPNPVTNCIYINNLKNDTYEYKIMALDGKVLKKGLCTNYILVEELHARLFVLELKAKSGKCLTFKVVKTN